MGAGDGEQGPGVRCARGGPSSMLIAKRGEKRAEIPAAEARFPKIFPDWPKQVAALMRNT
jgi:hypothetical protein